MNEITQPTFSINANRNKISWSMNNTKYTIEAVFITQLKVSFLNKKILVLESENRDQSDYPTTIKCYDFQGNLIFKTSKKTDCDFSHFTEDNKQNIFVVCSFNEKIGNWYDWQCSINLLTGELTRTHPAY